MMGPPKTQAVRFQSAPPNVKSPRLSDKRNMRALVMEGLVIAVPTFLITAIAAYVYLPGRLEEPRWRRTEHGRPPLEHKYANKTAMIRVSAPLPSVATNAD